MNEEQQLIVETAKRIFVDQCDKPVVDAAEAGEFPSGLWKTLEETGLTLAGVDENAGGSGGSFADALLLIREAGAAAAPIPLAEHLIAACLLATAKTTLPKGMMTLAILEAGKVEKVPFTETAEWVLWVQEEGIALLPTQDVPWQRRSTIAGESAASVDLVEWSPQARLVPLDNAVALARQMGAASRVNLMAGAITQVLAMSVQYVSDREQFGRPLAKFQAIQHQLAILAGESAACLRCANALLEDLTELDVAIGKARCGEAVTLVSDIAHQVHGAIGYTLEHGLNLRTRRLWQWRDEHGAERYWQIKIGQQFCRLGADGLWAGITEAG